MDDPFYSCAKCRDWIDCLTECILYGEKLQKEIIDRNMTLWHKKLAINLHLHKAIAVIKWLSHNIIQHKNTTSPKLATPHSKMLREWSKPAECVT